VEVKETVATLPQQVQLLFVCLWLMSRDETFSHQPILNLEVFFFFLTTWSPASSVRQQQATMFNIESTTTTATTMHHRHWLNSDKATRRDGSRTKGA
jgi:hypothetical protein